MGTKLVILISERHLTSKCRSTQLYPALYQEMVMINKRVHTINWTHVWQARLLCRYTAFEVLDQL